MCIRDRLREHTKSDKLSSVVVNTLRYTYCSLVKIVHKNNFFLKLSYYLKDYPAYEHFLILPYAHTRIHESKKYDSDKV